MNPAADPSPLLQRLAAQLDRRQNELRALLQEAAADAVGASEQPSDVQDFKDVAAEDSQAAVDEAALTHATVELRQVGAALRRLADGSYGFCLDCGEPIDERRLLALPATPFCTPCQSVRERPGPRR